MTTRPPFSTVVEWDELGQGYDADGNCVVCICGIDLPLPDGESHYCPYDDPDPREEYAA